MMMEAKEGMSHLLLYYAAIDRLKGSWVLCAAAVVGAAIAPFPLQLESGCLKTSNQIVLFCPLALHRVVTPGRVMSGVRPRKSQEEFDWLINYST
jgi:hypothetical protein